MWFDYIGGLKKDEMFEWGGKKGGERLEKSEGKGLSWGRDMDIKGSKK